MLLINVLPMCVCMPQSVGGYQSSNQMYPALYLEHSRHAYLVDTVAKEKTHTIVIPFQ